MEKEKKEAHKWNPLTEIEKKVWDEGGGGMAPPLRKYSSSTLIVLIEFLPCIIMHC